MSISRGYQGRRFKTHLGKDFDTEMNYLLPKMEVPEGKLLLTLKFGFSSKMADIDNPLKLTIDCLQRKYGFNDKQIYKLNVEKVDVRKGEEFIEFELSTPNKKGSSNNHNNVIQ